MAECMKSQLAQRASGIGLVERGYVSLLAFHMADDILRGTNVCREIAARLVESFKIGFFVPPAATVIFDIEPSLSIKRRVNTRMHEWSDPKRLSLMQRFFRSYAEAPLFEDDIRFIDAGINTSDNLVTVMDIIDAAKRN